MFPRWVSKALFRMLLLFQTILSKIAWAMGPVCVVVAFGLIFMVIFVYFTTILPHYMTTNYLGLIGALHAIFSVWMSFNIPFNYFMCITTNPGQTQGKVDPAQLSEDEYDYDYCKVCETMKPERAHHCTVCNRCTLRMDHHCPWMANCVGHFNYKYFVLFLLYLSVSCLYIAIVAGLPSKYGGLPSKAPVPYLGRGSVEFVMLLCTSVGAAVGAMTLWHLYLIGSQQTTIEFYQNQLTKHSARKQNMKWVNVYSLGISKNFDAVFGHNSLWFRWLLPSTKPPPGDGTSFWMREDVILKRIDSSGATYDV